MSGPIRTYDLMGGTLNLQGPIDDVRALYRGDRNASLDALALLRLPSRVPESPVDLVLYALQDRIAGEMGDYVSVEMGLCLQSHDFYKKLENKLGPITMRAMKSN